MAFDDRWLMVPGEFIDGKTPVERPVLVNTDTTNKTFRWCYSLDGDYVVTSTIGHDYIVTGAKTDVLRKGSGEINNEVWFAGETLQVYFSEYTSDGTWVLISKDVMPGHVAWEHYNDTYKRWDGDEYWVGSIPGTLTPRGTARGKSDIVITTSPPTPRYTRTTAGSDGSPAGIYTEVGTGTTLIIGLPSWQTADSAQYIRSLNATEGKYRYETQDPKHQIYYSQEGTWLIGKPNDPSGWWEGQEPSVSSPTTFIYKTPGESGNGTWDNKVLTFSGYVFGHNRTDVWATEVGVMREAFNA